MSGGDTLLSVKIAIKDATRDGVRAVTPATRACLLSAHQIKGPIHFASHQVLLLIHVTRQSAVHPLEIRLSTSWSRSLATATSAAAISAGSSCA